jgi:hypothetical protein
MLPCRLPVNKNQRLQLTVPSKEREMSNEHHFESPHKSGNTE